MRSLQRDAGILLQRGWGLLDVLWATASYGAITACRMDYSDGQRLLRLGIRPGELLHSQNPSLWIPGERGLGCRPSHPTLLSLPAVPASEASGRAQQGLGAGETLRRGETHDLVHDNMKLPNEGTLISLVPALNHFMF